MTEATRDAGPSAEPTPAVGFPKGPKIRGVSFSDLRAAFGEGVGDFLRAPLYGLVFAGVFVLGGYLLLASVALWDAPIAIIPLAIAFPLIGPFVAVGLYEVSRRLAAGLPLSWSEVLGVVFAQRNREFSWLAFVTLFIFWIWAYQVRLLVALFLGSAPLSSLPAFLDALLATENGLMFLGIGTVIGAALGLTLYSVTVIAAPLLLDRDIDIITAMATSVAVVRRNPGPMLAWAAFILAATLLALAPGFLGLFIALPIFGHAAWRLYARAIAPASPEAAA